MNHWVSPTHVLHKKDPFDSSSTVNENLAVKALLAVSICCLRQPIGQAQGGKQVVAGVRKKNLISPLTIRELTSFAVKPSPTNPESLSLLQGMWLC